MSCIFLFIVGVVKFGFAYAAVLGLQGTSNALQI